MSALATALRQPKIRYFFVVGMGFGVDFGLSMAVRVLLQFSLFTSASIGFFAALCFNYLWFEYWVYAKAKFQISFSRFLLTILAALLTLFIRWAVLFFFTPLQGQNYFLDAGLLLLAALVSLACNYLLVSKIFAGQSLKT